MWAGIFQGSQKRTKGIVLSMIFLLLFNHLGFGQDTETLMNRAIVKIELKSWEDAINDLNGVIKLRPELPEAFYYKGVALYFMGEYESAITHFDRAIQLNPRHARSYYFRGKCKSKRMEVFPSLADYKKVVTINPLNSGMFLYNEEENIF